jgi:hypothetical protein
MYARALFDIIHTRGTAVLKLLVSMQGGADEFFASANTRREVENQLWEVANTLAHLPPVVLLRLPQVDWAGWGALHEALSGKPSDQARERQDIVWYGATALLPATLVLLDTLREQEPDWFAIHY